ncbi:hypothetical protein J6590_050898 [Homalodisca vitripennis]|nr:hypothetical protein J6590_050898 [Homalodisca vitripennis]
MEAAFLATLSQAPVPQAGGRRHSVVTISRAPPTSVIFGRNRRESIAAFPGGLPRRDSSSSITGSNFNLQLDIMDDIAEIKAARKVRLKMWQNDNQDKVCEVQPLEGGPSSRYHQQNPGSSRRYSDVTGISAIPPPIPPRRRASEMPQVRRDSTPPPSILGKGIVCSNTDLISMLSSLTSSAQEIHNLCKLEGVKPTALDMKRSRLKGSRSNSFDISLLPEGKGPSVDKTENEASNWFIRRHQPMANKSCLSKEEDRKAKAIVTFADEKLKTSLAEKKKDEDIKTKNDQKRSTEKVLWDKPSGSVVDPQVIGSAIEEYLNQKGSETGVSSVIKDEPTPSNPSKTSKTSWFGSSTKNKPAEEEGTSASCDNSICSTLKDLFVK